VILQQNSGPLYVKSRVAMDFSGERGRVVADPNEALGVACEEGYNWRVGCLPCRYKILFSIFFAALPLFGYIWYVMLVRRKGNINRSISLLPYCVLTGRLTGLGFDHAWFSSSSKHLCIFDPYLPIKMFINYKREIYALAHLNLSTASFKCLS